MDQQMEEKEKKYFLDTEVKIQKQMEQEKKTVLYALANVARENSFYDEKHLERLQPDFVKFL